jgi:RHS repeat-associated protein
MICACEKMRKNSTRILALTHLVLLSGLSTWMLFSNNVSSAAKVPVSVVACSSPGTSTDRPNNRFPIHPNGTLVKTASNGTVFLIDGGRRRGITSQSVLNNLYPNGGFTDNDVITIDSDELQFYSPGTDVSATLGFNGRSLPDGKLIRASGGSEVSIISNNGRRRPFASSTRFQNLGYQFCNVIDISLSDYNSYPEDMAAGEFPTLSSPANGSTGQSLTPTFSWSAVAHTDSYRIAVATSASALPSDPGAFICPNCVIFGSTSNTSFTPSTPLNPGTQYFWQVEATDVPDFSVWSATRNFTTMTATDAMQVVSTTPSDGTTLGTNSLFTTTWKLKNTGQTTWSNYFAAWIQTDVDGHESHNLTSPLRVGASVPNAAPGTTVDLTVTMIVPPVPDTYFMYWQLQNASGTFFGPRFSVQIQAIQTGDESLGSDGEDFGTGDAPGSNAGMNDDSLNTATGNFNYRLTDLFVPGRGLNFVFGRSYNAKDPTTGPMGTGWSHSFNIFLFLSPNPDVVPVHYGDGKVVTFARTSGNTFKPLSKGYYDTLTKNTDSTWVLLKPDQREFRFNDQGRVTSIRDRNNNQINVFYGTNGNISRVVDTVGREFLFTYTNSFLTGITDPINRRLSFQYSGNRLVLFRDAKNNTNNFSYDGGGRISEIVDGRGIRIMSNSYDAEGRLVNQTNGRNFTWRVTYIIGTTTVTDPNQKQIVYTYDSGHKLVSFTNRLTQQNRVNIGYDSNNNRNAVNDPNSLANVYNYLYDSRNGLVTRSTDPDAKTRNFVYDSRNNPTQATNELNQTTTMGYDGRGNLITLTDALNNATSVNYDSFGQPTSITDPSANVTQLSYDAQGNLIRSEDALHNVTLYTYDGVGRRISTTDARGKITRFTYDDNDDLIAVQKPLGLTHYNYDQADNLISITDPRQNLTTFEYDANNNLTIEKDATRVFFVQHAFDSLDRRISTRDKRGNITTFEYDSEGRLLSVTDPLLNKTTYTYDGNGNRLTTTDANSRKTTFTYDKLNRVKSIQDSLGNVSKKDYDAASQLIAETDARGNTTRYTYDNAGNLVRVDDPEGGITRYNYDKNHNLINQVDANNNTSTLTYDKANRLIQTLDPLNNRYDYEYDGVGNRTLQTDAKRQTIRFTYDDNGRLITIRYPDSSTVQLSYDLNDNLTQVVDALGTTTYAYDQLNRISSYKDVFGKTIGYQYDPNGNIIALTYPDGKQVQYTYDKNNRMTSVTDWAGATVSYAYNSINLLTSASNTDNAPTTYTYDLAGRLTGLKNAGSRSGPNSYAFTLDQNGNRTSAIVEEPLNNAVAAKTQSSTYDTANRIQNAGSTTFNFDANGNMTRKTEGNNVTNYSYDFSDRLTSDQVNSFLYNGQGVRVAKSRAGVMTRYVVDVNTELSQVLCETDGSGNITSYYVYGQGLVYKVTPTNGHFYYQFDPNGSTISMITALDFSVNRYAYDPFGKITNKAEVFPNTGTTVPNPFRFGGRFGLMDDDNGLVYVRARYYAPELGRFLTKDPLTGDLKNGQSLNRFIYAWGNPVGLIDADGMTPNFADTFNNFKNNVFSSAGFSVASRTTFGVLDETLKNKVANDLAGSASIALSPAMEFQRSWKNPNLDITEKLARTSFNLGRTALIEIPAVAISPLCGPATLACHVGIGSSLDTYSDKTFERDFAARKRDLEPLGQWTYNTFFKKPEETAQYQATQKQLESVKQQQSVAAYTAPKLVGPPKIMPRGPAATPIQPRGPKPAPISPRGPAAIMRSPAPSLESMIKNYLYGPPR